MSLTAFLLQFLHSTVSEVNPFMAQRQSLQNRKPQAQHRLGHTGSACEALVKWSWDKKDLKDRCDTQLVHVQVIQLVRKELFRVCHSPVATH